MLNLDNVKGGSKWLIVEEHLLLMTTNSKQFWNNTLSLTLY